MYCGHFGKAQTQTIFTGCTKIFSVLLSTQADPSYFQYCEIHFRTELQVEVRFHFNKGDLRLGLAKTCVYNDFNDAKIGTQVDTNFLCLTT